MSRPLLIFCMGAFAAYVLIEWLLPDSQTKVVIEILLVVCVFAYAAVVGRQEYNARKHRDSTNKKVEVLNSCREEPLTKTDLTFLRKKMFGQLSTVAGAFLFVFCIYLLAANFFFHAFWGDLGDYLFWILSSVILMLAIYLFTRRAARRWRELQAGKKTIVIGNITRWERYPYNENDYILYIGQHSVRVSQAVFDMYAKGDAIEVHFFGPWKNMLLFQKKL